jgi:hypothetical protein
MDTLIAVLDDPRQSGRLLKGEFWRYRVGDFCSRSAQIEP